MKAQSFFWMEIKMLIAIAQDNILHISWFIYDICYVHFLERFFMKILSISLEDLLKAFSTCWISKIVAHKVNFVAGPKATTMQLRNRKKHSFNKKFHGKLDKRDNRLYVKNITLTDTILDVAVVYGFSEKYIRNERIWTSISKSNNPSNSRLTLLIIVRECFMNHLY